MKVEIKVMLLEVKECQKFSANHEKLGGRHEYFLPHSPRRSQPCHHLDLGLQAFRTETINFCCLSYPVCGTLLQKLEQTSTNFGE